jgi:hypothetical protein
MMHFAITVTHMANYDESFNQEMKWQPGVACPAVSKQEG